MSTNASPALSATRYLLAEPERFRTEFDQRAFAFRHTLCDSPLLDTQRVVELATQLAADPRDVYYDAGDVEIGQRWNEIPASDLSVEQLLHRIETANAWIVLRKIDKVAEYRELLDACMSELEDLSGRNLRALMKISNALLFISSPNRITTYHIDRECSCLLQIRGSKTISIFDRNDREVLTEDEIERFWTVDNNAPTYKPELQPRAAVYTLDPGDAVHLPVNSPHWVRNGPAVSISLNINFHYKDRTLADVYRMNHWLRRAGLKPTPPRRSPIADEIKRSVYGAAGPLRTLARGMRILRQR